MMQDANRQAPSENQKPPKRRVLIVDDNPSIHHDYRRILCSDETAGNTMSSAKSLLLGDEPVAEKKDFNIELVSAYQGEEAIELVRQSLADDDPFKLAFVDVRMPPGIDGIETISRIWDIEPSLHVVICTAFSDYSWEETSAELKHSDQFLILKKPFDISVVRQLASSLLAKHELAEQVRRQVVELGRDSTYVRAIIEGSHDAYIEADSACRITDWSRKAESLFGWDSDKIIGNELGLVLKPARKSNQSLAEWLSGITTHAAGQRREMLAVQSDGRELPVEVSVTTIDRDGTRFFNAFVQDITDRHKLQTQIGHVQKMESIGHLAAGIAHEINTPTQYVGDNTRFLLDAFSDIAIALGRYNELLQAAKDGTITKEIIANAETAIADADVAYLMAEVPNAINQSLEGVNRIATIVGAMKSFSHPGQKDKVDSDIHLAIESAIAISRNEWKYVAEIETDFASDMPRIRCQAGDLNQVFLNLIVNAAHAVGDAIDTESGDLGKITITTRVVDDWIELRISDTGTGIAEENRASLYDAFFTTKEVGKGTGQGLAIAHSVIVEGHDGTIDFETAVGQGTTFIIRLPLQNALHEEPAELEPTMIG